MVNKLLWKMPFFLHEFILKLTGYELLESVTVVAIEETKYPDGSIELRGCDLVEYGFSWVKTNNG